MLITPSATPYDVMTPEMIAAIPITGEYGSWKGPLKPSTKWSFHLDIMKARPEVVGIVHTHATYSTVLAIARKEIPAWHYMIAAFGGTNVRVADHARFGTKELSDHVLKALEGRSACLLANHGMIAVGPSLDKAMLLAVELETIARQYYLSLAIGGPVLLTEAEIAEAAAVFGLWRAGSGSVQYRREELRQNAGSMTTTIAYSHNQMAGPLIKYQLENPDS